MKSAAAARSMFSCNLSESSSDASSPPSRLPTPPPSTSTKGPTLPSSSAAAAPSMWNLPLSSSSCSSPSRLATPPPSTSTQAQSMPKKKTSRAPPSKPSSSPSSKSTSSNVIQSVFSSVILSSLLTVPPKTKSADPPSSAPRNSASSPPVLISSSSSSSSFTPLPSYKATPSTISESSLQKTRRLLSFKKSGERCTYIFKKKPRKGDRCDKYCAIGKSLCCVHLKPNSNKTTVAPSKLITTVPADPKIEYTNLKINRLKFDQRYRFVRPIPNRHGVVLKLSEKYYKVYIPRDMKIPTEGGGFYLVRHRGSKRTVWEQ